MSLVHEIAAALCIMDEGSPVFILCQRFCVSDDYQKLFGSGHSHVEPLRTSEKAEASKASHGRHDNDLALAPLEHFHWANSNVVGRSANLIQFRTKGVVVTYQQILDDFSLPVVRSYDSNVSLQNQKSLLDFTVGRPKMIQNMPLNQLNNTVIRSGFHFGVTSSRPHLKIAIFCSLKLSFHKIWDNLKLRFQQKLSE